MAHVSFYRQYWAFCYPFIEQQISIPQLLLEGFILRHLKKTWGWPPFHYLTHFTSTQLIHTSGFFFFLSHLSSPLNCPLDSLGFSPISLSPFLDSQARNSYHCSSSPIRKMNGRINQQGQLKKMSNWPQQSKIRKDRRKKEKQLWSTMTSVQSEEPSNRIKWMPREGQWEHEALKGTLFCPCGPYIMFSYSLIGWGYTSNSGK